MSFRFFVSKSLPFGFRVGTILPTFGGARVTRATPSAPARTGGSFVYVISGAHNRSKIGVSANPIARLASLRTASAFPINFAQICLVQGDGYDVEAIAHGILGRHRVHGEWFDVEPAAAIGTVHAAAVKAGRQAIPVDVPTVEKILAEVARQEAIGAAPTARAGNGSRFYFWFFGVCAAFFWWLYSVSPPDAAGFSANIAIPLTIMAAAAALFGRG